MIVQGMTRRFFLLPLMCGLLAPLLMLAGSSAIPAAEPATPQVAVIEPFPIERLLPARTVVLWLDEGFEAHQAGWNQTAANDSLSRTGVFRVGQQYADSFLKSLAAGTPDHKELDQCLAEVSQAVQSAANKGFAVAISLPDAQNERWPRLTVVLPQGGAFAKGLFNLCVRTASDTPLAPIVAKDDQRDVGSEVVDKNEEKKNEDAKKQDPQELKPQPTPAVVDPIDKKEQAIVEASGWKTEQVGTRVICRSVSGAPKVDACFWEERGHLVLVIGIGAMKSTLALADRQAPDITANPIWKELHKGPRQFDRRTYGWIDVKELRAAYDETPMTAKSLEAGLNMFFGANIDGNEIHEEPADPVAPLNQALPIQGAEVVANAIHQVELPNLPPEVLAIPAQDAIIQMVPYPWLPFVRWAQIVQPVAAIQMNAMDIDVRAVPIDGLKPLVGVPVPDAPVAGERIGIDFDFNAQRPQRVGAIVGLVQPIKHADFVVANPKIDVVKNDAVKNDEPKNDEVETPIPAPSAIAQAEGTPPSVTLKQLLTVLGLDSVQNFTWQSGYQGRSLWSESYLSAPGPKRGLLGFTDQPQIRFDQLPPLPANISAFSATSIDLNNFSESTLQVIKSVAPMLTGAKAGKVGLAIKKWRLRNRELFGELTAGLDSLVCVYNDRTNGPFEFGPVLVWKVKNAVQLRQGLDKFIGVLDDVLQQANAAAESAATDVNVVEVSPVDLPAGNEEDDEEKQPAAAPEQVAHVASMISIPALKVVKSTHFGREFVGVQFQFINKSFQDGKLTGTHTSDIPLGIVFTVDDNWLAVSVNSQLIEAFLLRVDGKLPSWEPTAAHRDALRDLPDQFTSISVDDPRVSLPQLVSLGYCGLAWFETLLQSQPGQLKAPKVQPALPNLPPPEYIVQPLFPNITVTKVDESGVRSYTRNSLPSVTKLRYAAGYGLFMTFGAEILEDILPF